MSAKLSELQARFPRYIDRVEQLGTELERLGLTPDNTYLYIQGHHIMDCVVLKILIPVCTVLRREREQEIKRLAEHNEQFRNELTGYENSQVNVSVMLKKQRLQEPLSLSVVERRHYGVPRAGGTVA